ncbi:hypothetical protein PVK06_026751 [Gossypium arboreum]|uniref:Uncharacterized protein n=1 Tax=Gossypium arboreum TaxID=29729 RepID=A0ABR0NZS4_GOSAR|nr:hypothetical protein PVK06_026751 [Gossypium arboreum]
MCRRSIVEGFTPKELYDAWPLLDTEKAKRLKSAQYYTRKLLTVLQDVEKEEDSRDVEECIPRIDSLVEGDFIAGQEMPTVGEKDVCVVVVNRKAKEENTEKEYAKNIVNASKFVGATIDNLEPLKVTPPTQEVVEDAGATLEIEKPSENCAKPKEKKRKCFKDKKCKNEEKKRRRKKHRAATLMAEEN